MRYSPLLSSIALLGVLAFSASAHADTFDFSVMGHSGSFSGSGTLTATAQGGGQYLISDITGTGVTGLIAPNGFNGNDNLLFPSEKASVDSSGFSFTDVNGPDHYDVNIFNKGNGNGFFAYLKDEDNLTQTVPVTFSLASAQTPEPSTFILLGTGILGLAGATRRKFFSAS